jgi:deoxyadenosine/deoxycytidine kinase
LQVYFLNGRFRQTRRIKELVSEGKSVIQDRTIYEDAHIFAANLHQSGLLAERDYNNYYALFESMISLVDPPDLLLYLRADLPKLIGQIEKRGRNYENSISIEYLKNLNEHYDQWIAEYQQGKLLIIDVNELDYVRNPEDLGSIIERIDNKLFGLF